MAVTTDTRHHWWQTEVVGDGASRRSCWKRRTPVKGCIDTNRPLGLYNTLFTIFPWFFPCLLFSITSLECLIYLPEACGVSMQPRLQGILMWWWWENAQPTNPVLCEMLYRQLYCKYTMTSWCDMKEALGYGEQMNMCRDTATRYIRC